MNVYLERVTPEKRDLLWRLLEYSLYEESENGLKKINEDGVFEYKYFDKYFTEKDRDAYIIREQGSDQCLGFAMVNTYLQKFEKGHSIAEYMVLPGYRRNKIGQKVAFALFDRYPGNWEVKPSYQSQKAYLFWENTIQRYTNHHYRWEDGLFLFQNDAGRPSSASEAES